MTEFIYFIMVLRHKKNASAVTKKAWPLGEYLYWHDHGEEMMGPGPSGTWRTPPDLRGAKLFLTPREGQEVLYYLRNSNVEFEFEAFHHV